MSIEKNNFIKKSTHGSHITLIWEQTQSALTNLFKTYTNEYNGKFSDTEKIYYAKLETLFLQQTVFRANGKLLAPKTLQTQQDKKILNAIFISLYNNKNLIKQSQISLLSTLSSKVIESADNDQQDKGLHAGTLTIEELLKTKKPFEHLYHRFLYIQKQRYLFSELRK